MRVSSDNARNHFRCGASQSRIEGEQLRGLHAASRDRPGEYQHIQNPHRRQPRDAFSFLGRGRASLSRTSTFMNRDFHADFDNGQQFVPPTFSPLCLGRRSPNLWRGKLGGWQTCPNSWRRGTQAKKQRNSTGSQRGNEWRSQVAVPSTQ